MAKFTSAYSAFLVRIDEVRLLQRKAATLERADAVGNAAEIKALCRSGIVLLSSHIEGYVKDVAELTLDKMFQKSVSRDKLSPRIFHAISRDQIDEIKDTDDHEKIVKKIFGFINQDLIFWSKSGPFPTPIPSERFMKGFASPSVEKIGAFWGRFGYSKFTKDLAANLKNNFNAATAMINNVVVTRNNIAHGDASETRTPGDLLDMINLTIAFCRGADSVFGNWCTKNICSIREF